MPVEFQQSETVESVLIVEALDETNRSKLMDCDVASFDSLKESLFPVTDIPRNSDSVLDVGCCFLKTWPLF